MVRPWSPVLATLLLAGCGGGGGSQDARSVADVRECLARADLSAGEASRAPDDFDAPDTELTVHTTDAVALLAFYGDEQRAQRVAADVKKNARAARATVERHGSLTIVWIRGARSRGADTIRSCAV